MKVITIELRYVAEFVEDERAMRAAGASADDLRTRCYGLPTEVRLVEPREEP